MTLGGVRHVELSVRGVCLSSLPRRLSLTHVGGVGLKFL